MNKLQNKLISIFVNRFSGKVTLSLGEKEKTLFFKHGEIIYASSYDDQSLFLHVLLNQTQLKPENIENLETLNSIEEQQKYILKNNLLSAKELFSTLQKLVEESFYNTFYETYENINIEKNDQKPTNPFSFDIHTFPLILRFIEKFAQNNDLIDEQQELYLSDEHKALFLNIKLKTSFRKIIDLLNQRKQTLRALEDQSVVNKLDDTYTFLYFLFILGFIGKKIKEKPLEDAQKTNPEINVNAAQDLKEKQVERLLKAPPHLLIGADRNLSEAILYKNTIKLIKRYDIFSNSNKYNYKKLYENLIEALYILTSPELNKEYYNAISNNEPFTLEKGAKERSKLLYTEAKFLFSENMLNESLEKIKAANELSPNNHEYVVFMYNIILYYCSKNQKVPSEKIEEELKSIIEVDSTYKDAKITLARYYRMTGNKKKQLITLIEALENDPEDLLLAKKVLRLKTQLTKNKSIKKTSGIFKLEKSEKKTPFAGLFKKKDSKKKK
ncbi:MAG TPA: hypothetical protein PKC21_01145 [Oligoflexia bacterium]|nr:hypothetical protein [Oligoflexia bacterium]HMR23935.1 hypothetical protein [Oligoflexia bacterium]